MDFRIQTFVAVCECKNLSIRLFLIRLQFGRFLALCQQQLEEFLSF